MADIIIERNNRRDISLGAGSSQPISISPIDNKAVWGHITGSLPNQLDLEERLNEINDTAKKALKLAKAGL